jgi:DNA modification methylase
MGTAGRRKSYERFSAWDSERPSAELLARLIAITRAQIVWGGNYFPSLPTRQKWLVWDKGQRIDQSDGELAWTSMDGALRICTISRACLNQDGAVHPTQKPERLMRWCLNQVEYVRTVLDPFMGSGTTLVACKRFGKSAIGIEREERYCEIAVQRLAQDTLPLEFEEAVIE